MELNITERIKKATNLIKYEIDACKILQESNNK